MEIKHTIEILTKDIQDIEKLVGNLKNYPVPPRIELDLAMAKLRNVYELLAMISTDVKKDMKLSQEEISEAETTAKETASPVQDTNEADDSDHMDNSPAVEEPVESETAEKASAMAETASSEITETDTAGTDKAAPDLKASAVSNSGSADTEVSGSQNEHESSYSQQELLLDLSEEPENLEEESIADLPQEEKLRVPTEEKADNKQEEKKSAILADKFAANASINEKIASPKDSEVAKKLSGEPIDSIRRNIGINDRFMIIRELMAGETEVYNSLIEKLDSCNNFNEAFKIIEGKFPEKLEHDGVKLLVNLSRRKFISSGNV